MVVSPSTRVGGLPPLRPFSIQARYSPSRRRSIFSSWTISASHKATIVDHLNRHLVDPRSWPRDLARGAIQHRDTDPSPILNTIPLIHLQGRPQKKHVTPNNVGWIRPSSLAIALHNIVPILFPHYYVFSSQDSVRPTYGVLLPLSCPVRRLVRVVSIPLLPSKVALRPSTRLLFVLIIVANPHQIMKG
ncbi:hypothetical protein LZ31DRAFT_118192 [Colletotrichum somersetense]|nr:hypothetical protein LZ31DRAFT_118192 [Colletotrichum somersetense]